MVAHALLGIFVMGCLIYIIQSDVIRCPEQAEWNIRAEIQCQNITKYFCLYNYINYTYEEGCTGPDWDRPGSKRVFSKNFNRAPCRDTRYQPIKFVTNGNSDCIFRKSLCTEEGQTLFEAGTTRTDNTCRCDYTQGYAFVSVPRNKCYCRPSEEDCSCYRKKCQGGRYYLSADYECTKYFAKTTVCPLMVENPSEDPHFDMVPPKTHREDNSYPPWRHAAARVITVLFLLDIFLVLYIKLYQRQNRSLHRSTEQICNAESESMETGPSLNTTERNSSNDKSAVEAHTESGRMDAGPSLDTIDQNATNDQTAVEVHIESGRKDTGPSLDTGPQCDQ